MPQTALPRTIGLAGAAFTLVGYVIGASIFILPGQLAADAGPAAFLSYLIAGVLAALACVVGAVIGSAVSVSGAANVAAARALGPVFGFMGVWLTLVAVVVSIALVGFGLADYLAYFFPGLDRTAVALGSVLLLGALNLTTVQLTVWVQGLMTAAFLVILFLFGLGGVAHARPELLTPFMPNGFAPVATGAVLAFFSYAGCTVITEIGGEIKNPARTIPVALLISFGVILVSYVLVSFAVPALLPWHTLAEVEAPVARAAETFLPTWVGAAIAIGALLAAATSINGMLLIHSRDVLAMARAQVFPVALSKRSPRTGVPGPALLLVTTLSVGSVLLGGSIRQYAMMAVMSVMILQIFQGLSLLRLPNALPVEWSAAGFRLGRVARLSVGGLLILSSIGFFLMGLADNSRIAALYLVVVALGVSYYYARRAIMARAGVAIDAALRSGATAEG
jgi:APA family basic amino acid/polyamine antiporter